MHPRGIVKHLRGGRWPVVLIVALPLLIYWPLTVGGRVLYWGLPLYQFYPWHTLVVEAVQAGRLPLWTDLLGNGTPLLANHQSALFYPLNLIYFLAPVERAMGYSVVLHLILAGLFAYAWGRTVGLSRFGAAITGLSFMLSGFFMSRTQFITILNGAAWLPLLFLLAERLIRRRTPLAAIWLGLTWALQFLAGHAQLWFYGLWVVGGYLVARSMVCSGINESPVVRKQGSTLPTTYFRPLERGYKSRRAWREHGRVLALLVGAFLLSLGLSAIQLLPTAELALHSERVDGLGVDKAMTYSLWPWRLLTLAAPDLFGSPAAGNYWGYATYWEDAGYAGVSPLLLVLVLLLSAAKQIVLMGWRRLPFIGSRKRVGASQAKAPHRGNQPGRFFLIFFFLLIPLSLILAMGQNTPVYPLLFKYVPGFGAFRAPARFLLFYTFGFSTLAGIGADRFRLSYRTQYVLRLTLAGAGAMLAVSLAAGQAGLTIKPTFAPAVARFAIWLGLSAGALLLCPTQVGGEEGERDPRVMRSPLSPGVWRGLIVGLAAIDLALFALPLTPSIDPALYRATTDVDRFLLSRADETRLFATHVYDYDTKFDFYFDFSAWGPSDLAHWLSFRETLVPNLNVFSRTPGVNNDDPLVIGRWRELMDALRGADWSARLRLLCMLNVGYVLAESPPPGLPPVEGAPHLYRLPDPMPRVWMASRARVISDPDQLLAELMAPAFDPASEVLLEALPRSPDLSGDSQVETGTSSEDHPPATSGQHPPSSLVATSLREEGNSRTIDLVVSRPGYLVLAYTHYPGWRASVDGRPAQLLRANYALMALPLEPGEHRVVLRYRPLSLTLGALISGLSLLAMIGVAISKSTSRGE